MRIASDLISCNKEKKIDDNTDRIAGMLQE